MPYTPHKGLALAVLALTQLMIVLDASIVNVALKDIQDGLGFSAASLQWTVTAYTLMFGGFLLLGGRVADRYGRRLVFMSGLVLFVVASAAAGVAQDTGTLVVARGIQGLGGAFMSPAALSLLVTIFEEGEERHRAFGVWGAIAAGGAAIGLLAGGVLTEFLSWRWCFFVNIPVGVLAIVGSLKFVPESHGEHVRGFDVAGAVTVTGGLIALVYGLVQGNELGWASAQTLATFGLALVLLAVFVSLQLRREHPLLPLRIFRNRNVLGADLAVLLVGAGMFAMFFFVSLYLRIVLEFSVLKTGFAFLPVSLIIMASAGVGSKLLSRFSPRDIAPAGMLIASVGMMLLVRVEPGGSYVTTVLVPLLIMGSGMGMSFVSLTSASLTGVPQGDSGLASALLNTAQQIGGSLGLALLTAVSTARVDAVLPTSLNPAAAQTSGWAWAFFVASGLLVLGAIVGRLIINAAPGETAEAPPEGSLDPATA